MASRPTRPDDQAALPLSLEFSTEDNPCSPESLKAAYTRAGLWPRYTFEQAMSDPTLATALRLAAEAAAKHRKG